MKQILEGLKQEWVLTPGVGQKPGHLRQTHIFSAPVLTFGYESKVKTQGLHMLATIVVLTLKIF